MMPVPLPEATPFEDKRHRDIYLKAFAEGWEFAICGNILFAGPVAPPYDLPPDLTTAWEAGWREGASMGGEEMLAKLTAGQ